MCRRCARFPVECIGFLSKVRRVATSVSGETHHHHHDGRTANRGTRSEINGLLREINDLYVRRGFGEHKLSISASKLQSSSTTASSSVSEGSSVPQCQRPTTPLTSIHLPKASTNMTEPATYTNIACTLQELEDELFRMSVNDLAMSEAPKDMDANGLKTGKCDNENNVSGSGTMPLLNDPQEEQQQQQSETLNSRELKSSEVSAACDSVDTLQKLSCWTAAVEPDLSKTNLALYVSKSSDCSTFILELRERPHCVRAVIEAASEALNKVEAEMELGEGLTVVFRSSPGIPFFTPLLSELHLSHLTRVDVLQAKERLFCRLREARHRGVSFAAELSGSAFDFGAELFFMCDSKIISESETSDSDGIRFGFPSISLGLWPAPCVLQHIVTSLGYKEELQLVAPNMHTIPYNELRKKYPGLFLNVDRTSEWWIWERAYCFFLTFYGKFLHGVIGSCDKRKNKDVLMSYWGNYCALLNARESGTKWNPFTFLHEDETAAASRALEMYMGLLGTQDFRNTTSVSVAFRSMRWRLLNPQPRKESIIEVQPSSESESSCMGGVNMSKSFCVFTDATSYPAAARFVAGHRSFGSDVVNRALLMGDADQMRDVAELLDCAVVATHLRPLKLRSLGEGGDNMVEVQLLCASNVSISAQKEALSFALSYLQSKDIPYVVTRGNVGNRLVAALFVELCRLASETEMEIIDAAAREELRFRVNPFQLVDHHGMKHIAKVIDRYPHFTNKNQVVSTTRRVLSAMSAEGFDGERGRRGGFYNHYGCVNPEVATEFLARRKVSQSDIFLRLLSALVNEICCLLLEGCVETVEDMDLISIGALTLDPSTGGILSQLDSGMGCLALLRNMNFMSRDLGVIALPSPLLRAMVEAGETFRTLTPETLYQARQQLRRGGNLSSKKGMK